MDTPQTKPATVWPCDIKRTRVQAPAHHPCRQPRAGRQVDPGMDSDLATTGNVGQGHQMPHAPHPNHVPTMVERWFYRTGWRLGVGQGLVGGGLLGFLAAMALVSLGRMWGGE